MSVITSGSFAKLLWPGLNSIYGKEYNDYAVEWDKLFEKNTSDKAYEEDVGLSSFGLASVKNEGAPITYDSERQGFTTRYNHVVYAPEKSSVLTVVLSLSHVSLFAILFVTNPIFSCCVFESKQDHPVDPHLYLP